MILYDLYVLIIGLLRALETLGKFAFKAGNWLLLKIRGGGAVKQFYDFYN
jgi:hypothetical protein